MRTPDVAREAYPHDNQTLEPKVRREAVLIRLVQPCNSLAERLAASLVMDRVPIGDLRLLFSGRIRCCWC